LDDYSSAGGGGSAAAATPREGDLATIGSLAVSAAAALVIS